MKLAFFIHDCFKHIGQGNVTIETINNLPADKIENIKIYCFSCGDKQDLFPKVHEKVVIEKYSFGGIKPVLLKIILFQIFSYFSIIKLSNYKTISLGIAAPSADTHIIHFIHKQWDKIYFSMYHFGIIKLIYKKIMYLYLNSIESISYNKKKKIITISSFLKEYIVQNFSINEKNIEVIYNGIESSEYYPLELNKDQIKIKLKDLHPEISNINLEKPILLFVGGFQRKGLEIAIKNIPKDVQLVAIGDNEMGNTINLPKDVFHIKWSQSLNLFYNLADAFVFPSRYEPFGLVIVEAFAAGLPVYTLDKNIGACEILKEDSHFFQYTEPNFLSETQFKTFNFEMRNSNLIQRKNILMNFSWENTGKRYYEFLTS